MASPPNLDRVQAVKWESPDHGGTETDEYPVGIEETEDALSGRGFYFQPAGGPADEEVLVWRDGDDLKLQDKTVGTVKTLAELASGGGMTPATHHALDDMVHWLVDTNYQEIVRSGGKVTNVINWTDAGKTVKVREMAITRAAGKVSQMDFIQYDGAGVESQRMTGVITRAAGKVASIAWTKTGSP